MERYGLYGWAGYEDLGGVIWEVCVEGMCDAWVVDIWEGCERRELSLHGKFQRPMYTAFQQKVLIMIQFSMYRVIVWRKQTIAMMMHLLLGGIQS